MGETLYSNFMIPVEDDHIINVQMDSDGSIYFHPITNLVQSRFECTFNTMRKIFELPFLVAINSSREKQTILKHFAELLPSFSVKTHQIKQYNITRYKFLCRLCEILQDTGCTLQSDWFYRDPTSENILGKFLCKNEKSCKQTSNWMSLTDQIEIKYTIESPISSKSKTVFDRSYFDYLVQTFKNSDRKTYSKFESLCMPKTNFKKHLVGLMSEFSLQREKNLGEYISQEEIFRIIKSTHDDASLNFYQKTFTEESHWDSVLWENSETRPDRFVKMLNKAGLNLFGDENKNKKFIVGGDVTEDLKTIIDSCAVFANLTNKYEQLVHALSDHIIEEVRIGWNGSIFKLLPVKLFCIKSGITTKVDPVILENSASVFITTVQGTFGSEKSNSNIPVGFMLDMKRTKQLALAKTKFNVNKSKWPNQTYCIWSNKQIYLNDKDDYFGFSKALPLKIESCPDGFEHKIDHFAFRFQTNFNHFFEIHNNSPVNIKFSDPADLYSKYHVAKSFQFAIGLCCKN